MGSKDTICENERRRSHSGHTNSFSFQVRDRVNVCFHARLDAQTSPMDSGQESYIQTLFDRLQKEHHQMMSDVETAKRQGILVSGPVAFHQFGLESLLLEKAF